MKKRTAKIQVDVETAATMATEEPPPTLLPTPVAELQTQQKEETIQSLDSRHQRLRELNFGVKSSRETFCTKPIGSTPLRVASCRQSFTSD